MIDRNHPDLPVIRQCEILDLPRSTFYHVADPVSDADHEIMALIDRCYLERPFYGSRRIRGWLADEGHQLTLRSAGLNEFQFDRGGLTINDPCD